MRNRDATCPGSWWRGQAVSWPLAADGQAAAADVPAAGGPLVLAGGGSAEPGDRQAGVRGRVYAVHRGAFDFRPGEQLISVVRKGTRAVQELPASADAFVWHRLYQQELPKMGVPPRAGSATARKPGPPGTD
jgi:hypothetical protein